MNVDGELYPHGSQHYPNERRLQMTRADLLAMTAACADPHRLYWRYEPFVITNPITMLWALATTPLAVSPRPPSAVLPVPSRRRANRLRTGAQHSGGVHVECRTQDSNS